MDELESVKNNVRFVFNSQIAEKRDFAFISHPACLASKSALMDSKEKYRQTR